MIAAGRHLRSFRNRLVFAVALVHALLMTLFVVDTSRRQRRLQEEDLQQDLYATTSLLATTAKGWLSSQGAAGLQELFSTRKSDPALVYALFTDASGRILAHTDPSKLGRHVGDLPSQHEPTLVSSDDGVLALAVPVLAGSAPAGWVRVGFDTHRNRALAKTAAREGLAYALLAMLGGTLFAVVLGNALTRRVRRIQEALDRFRTGDRSQRTRLLGGDELSELSTGLDLMLDDLVDNERQLDEAHRALRVQNEQLEQTVQLRTEELQQRTEELALEHRQLQTAQAVAHIGSWHLDIPTGSLTWSRETHVIFGVDVAASLTLEHFFAIIHPEDLEKVSAAWSRTVATKEPYDIEHRILTSRGTRWVRERAEVEYSAAGEPLRGIGTVQDITFKKEQELTLKQSEARARAILDASTVPMALNDASLSVLYLNPAFVQTFGYTLEEIPSVAEWEPRAYPDAAYRQWATAQWDARLREAASTGRFSPLEVDVRAKDGRLLRVQSVATQLGGPEEGLVLVSLYDVTALHDANIRLKTLLDTASDAIHIVDEQGRLVQWSESFLGLLGTSATEAATLHIWDWDTRAPREEVLARLPGMLAELQGRSRTLEALHRRRDGSLVDVELSICAVVIDGKSHMFASGRDITERKRAEEALHMEVGKNRALLQQASDGIHVLDCNGRVLMASDSFAHMLGYEPEQVVGMHVSQWEGQFRPEELESLIRSHFDGQRRLEFTTTHRRRDGSTFEVEVSGQPLRLDGQPVMYYSSRDITERKAVEQALRESLNETQRLNGVLQGREGTIVALKRHVDWLSAELGRELPFPTFDPKREALPVASPQPLGDAVGLAVIEDFQPWQQLLDAVCAATGVSASIIDLQGQVIVASRQQPICTQFHRQAPESRRNCIASNAGMANELAKELASTLHTCPNGMTVAAAPIQFDGRHVANVFIGQFLLATPDADSFARQARRCGYDVDKYTVALEHVPVLTQAQAEIALKAMLAIAGLVATTALDAHRRKQMHAEWRAQQLNLLSVAEDARRAQEMAERASRAKGDFLANMSHEIRTPLNGVIGLSHLMLETPLTPRQQDYMGKICSSSNTLLRILNDILDYSKLEADRMVLERAPFRIDALVSRITGIFSFPAEEKGLELLFEVTARVPDALLGDGMRIEQVLINLVGNAIKFTECGDIHVKLDVEGHPAGGVWLLGSVRDTGIGVAEETRAKLFQSFTQADSSTTRRFGGSGLGLAICRRIVELMDGQIGLDSTEGVGSTFHFRVRLEKVDGTQPAQVPQALRGMRALVADDNQTSLEILQRTLEAWSVEVETASGGPEALQKIQQTATSGRPFEVLLLDAKMPELDGIAVTRIAAREQLDRHFVPPPVVIMVTASGKDEVRREAGELQFHAVLEKPVVPSALFDVLMNLQLDRRSGETASAPALSLRDQARPLWGARVLLAEDNVVNQLVGKELLEHLGLVADLAENGEIAVTMAERNRYACILMDLHMPEVDGFSATRRIRQNERGRHVPILAMTAAALTQDREAAIAAGMNDHVAKPVDPARLLNALLRWIPGQPAEAPEEPAPAVLAEAGGRFELEGFNLDAAAQRMGGNWNALRKALLGFVTEFASLGSKLASAVESGRWEQAALLVHTLKGAAGNLGDVRLHALARRLEEGLRRKDATALGEVQERLSTAFATIATLRASEPHPLAPSAFDAARAMEDIHNLRGLLKAQRLVPQKALSRLHQGLMSGPNEHLVQQFVREVDAFDYPAALQSLAMLGESLGIGVDDPHD